MAESIIPLSRWRAALARARVGRRAEALLALPDADKVVPEVPVQDLYYAIQEVGLADAGDLVALASPEQVRGLVDLDVWERDRLDEHKLNAWIATLVDAGPDKLGAAVDALDADAVALWLQRQARVYDLTIEAPPPEPEGHFYPTPDRFYLLDVLADGEEGKALERAIDWLYRASLDLGRRVVMSAKWELASDLEEWSYRWRSGRMADLGYVEFYEALAVYRFLDPASVKVDQETVPPPLPDAPTALPSLYAGSLDEHGFFARALATISDERELERLHGALITLVNKTLAADRAEPGDLDAGRQALVRAAAYLGLGLEQLGRGDLVRAGRVLGQVALERVFRVGFSLTLQLKRLADTLVAHGRVQVGPDLLLDAPYDAVVTALRRPKPEYARVLEAAPAAGTRPFASLAEIARAAAALDDAARVAPLILDGWGVPLAALEREAARDPTLTFGRVGRTLAAQVLLGRPPLFAPLGAAEVAGLGDPRGRADEVARALAELAQVRGVAPPPPFRRWIEGWLAELAAAPDVFRE